MSLLIISSRDARSLVGGMDADKPAQPRARDVYLALDTGWLYICFDSGTWVKYGRIVSENPGFGVTSYKILRKEVAVA